MGRDSGFYASVYAQARQAARRPESIVYFERYYIVVFVLSVLDSLYQAATRYRAPLAAIARGFDGAALAGIVVSAFLYAIVTSPFLLLALAVSRRRSRIALWLLVYAVASAAVGLAVTLARDPRLTVDRGVLLVELLLAALALYFTTYPEARAWLRRRTPRGGA